MTFLRFPLLAVIALSAASCGHHTATSTDTIPPAAVTDLRVESNKRVFSLRWTAPGDDGDLGRATRYDIRYAASDLEGSWDAAPVIPSPRRPAPSGHPDSLLVEGIGPGPWEFGIRAADLAGNWSPVSNIATARLVPDTIPPAVITDLEVRTTGQGFRLRWTAPGDDGDAGRASEYDVRYASADLAGGWDEASVVSSPPEPGPPGTTDSLMVAEIGWGPWEFGIRTSDGWNWSGISNIVTTTIPEDTTPPGPVTDLSVEMLTEGGAVLGWTAVADDDGGPAAAYDLRTATAPITEETWPAATRVDGVGTPRSPGERERFPVTGLDGDAESFFAMRVLDDVENISGLSNQASAAIPSPVQITFLTSTSDPHYPNSPDWSPDGQTIVFSASWQMQSTYPSPQLSLVPASGGNVTRVTSLPGAGGPSWSPDGSRWAFGLYVDDLTRTVLGIMDARSGAAPDTLVDPRPQWWYASGARWSPDGSRIAYIASRGYPGQTVSELQTVASAGGDPGTLAGDGTFPMSGLDWSPDGTRIVFSPNQGGAYHLWLIDSDGSTATPLTSGAGSETGPAWSPDGSWIAYVENREAIWVISPSGEDPTRLTFSPAGSYVYSPAWSPDGTRIAYEVFQNQNDNLWVLRVR